VKWLMTHSEATEGLPSASQFDADFRCPGKWAMEAAMEAIQPDDQDTWDTARGMRIHKALEKSELSELSGSEEVTASICMDIDAQLIDQYDFHDAAEIIREKRMWDVDDNFNKLWSAQLDFLVLKPRRALLNDYKTGWSITSIANNWQIRAQAALVWMTFGVGEVVVALSHPHSPDGPMEVEVFSAQRCAEFMTTIRGHVAEIQKPNKPRIPNGISCEYCRAKHVCPERLASLDQTGQNLKDEIKEEGFTSLLNRTPKERGEHFRLNKELHEHSALIMQRYARMEEEEEGSVAGYRVQKKWDRKISALHESEAIGKIENEFGSAVIGLALKLSLPACEEAIKRIHKMTTKDARAKMEACLGDAINWKLSQAWLVERRNYFDAWPKPKTGA
jgi:hypothetical protein